MSRFNSRLRVALVSSSFTRDGAEKQFFYVCRSLHEAGATVRVYAYGPEGFYSRVLRDANIPVCDVYCPGRRLAMLLRLTRGLLAFRPHVVWVSQFGDGLYGGVAGRLCRGLVLVGVRSNGLAEMTLYRRRAPWVLRLGHALIPNSWSAHHNLLRFGVAATRMQVLPNVIELGEFDRQSRRPFLLPLAPERIVVAAVGRLERWTKRLDRFLCAVALARETAPALAGLIVGRDQDAKASLLRQAESLGLLPDGLVFLPETDQVPALLRRVHMLALTSDCEGFPNVILEAMAARLPVISTPAGDAAQIVQDGKTGWVVEYDDVQGLAERMIQLAQASSMRTRFGEAGRERVEQEYNYEGLANRLVAIFHRFADRQPKSPVRQILERGVPTREPMAQYEALASR